MARSAGEQLSPKTTPAAALRVRPEDDIQALRGLDALVALSDKDSGLVRAVSDSAILGMKLARMVQDSIGTELRVAALRIGRDTASPAEAERRLRESVTRLFQLRFMERTAGRQISADIPPNQRLSWDVGRLELALSLRGEFDQALVMVANVFPGQPPDRMRRAFQTQLLSRALDVAASAQRFTPILTADSSVEVRSGVGNLDLSTSRIRRTGMLLDSLGAKAEGRMLITAATRQAEQALAMTQAMYERGHYLEPVADSIARWVGVGVQPLSYRALGMTSDIDFEAALVRQVSGIGQLAHDVRPALAFLHSPNADSTRLPRLLKAWDDISTAIDKWERGDQTSTLSTLHRFIRQDMNVTDPGKCAQFVATRDTASGGDVFMVKRRQFRAAMTARCGTGGTEAANAYGRLRATFVSRLAGRYPFVDSARAAVAPDADAAAVRDFLSQYDDFVEAGNGYALRADPRLAALAAPASAWLAQVHAVRAFLAPVADNPKRAPEFTLTIGEGDLQHVERWIYGQPVVLSTIIEDSTGKFGELTLAGGWAAIRALNAGATYDRVRAFHPDTKRELVPPTFPASAPEIFRTATPAPAPASRVVPTKAAATTTKIAPNSTKQGAATKAATPRPRANTGTKAGTKTGTKAGTKTKGRTKRP